jgi:hypothetical protein
MPKGAGVCNYPAPATIWPRNRPLSCPRARSKKPRRINQGFGIQTTEDRRQATDDGLAFIPTLSSVLP